MPYTHYLSVNPDEDVLIVVERYISDSILASAGSPGLTTIPGSSEGVGAPQTGVRRRDADKEQRPSKRKATGESAFICEIE